MNAYQIGRVFGIPIKVHITLLIFLPILAIQISAWSGMHSVLWGLMAALGLFASVALHELGHAVLALSKRIGVREILLLPIGGLAQLSRMPERPEDELHIALAGPIVSFALAVSLGFLFFFLRGWFPVPFTSWLGVLAGMNLMLAAFNMLPSFPMDGGRIFRAWLSPRIGHVAATRIAAKIGRGMAIAFGIWGLFRGSLLTIAVAVFIYLAAGAEYRMVLQQARWRGGFSPFAPPPEPEEDEDPVVVSPPPYARSTETDLTSWWRKTHKRVQKFFDDFVAEWKKDER